MKTYTATSPRTVIGGVGTAYDIYDGIKANGGTMTVYAMKDGTAN